MNRAKPVVAYLPKLRLRPEMTHCPHCQMELTYSHPVWAKPVYGLSEASFVTSLGFRCLNADCRYPRTVYRSAQAESLTIKGSTYGWMSSSTLDTYGCTSIAPAARFMPS